MAAREKNDEVLGDALMAWTVARRDLDLDGARTALARLLGERDGATR